MYVIDAYNLLYALRRVADLPGEHARARARMVEMRSVTGFGSLGMLNPDPRRLGKHHHDG